jgi:4-hydroxybenzoyl-CoA reductase alpha subunit
VSKITGQTQFADDIILPRMLHCKLLRSSMPHAEIESMDVAAARDYPGVYLVLTGDDFPVEYGILPVSQDERPLSRDKVRYVGDPVAAVIARDEKTACEAIELIDVSYRPLPTVSSVDEAILPSDSPLHDYAEEANIHRRLTYSFGDVEEALADADHIFDDTFFYEGNTHLAMEQHASVGVAEPGGRVTLWTSTQNPHYLHRAISKALQIPAAHIRVIATPNGGGFGGKCDPFNHEIVVTKASLLLGRPVKICLTREEVFYCHRGRHQVTMRFRTGVNKDGKLTGMHLQTLLDGGAHGSHGIASTFYSAVLQPITYHLPRYGYQACRVFTNKPPCGPKRGHGTPQPRFGQEVQIDKIAEKLKMDPAEFRLNIAEKPDSLTASYMKIGTIGLVECINRVVDRSDWKNKYRKLPEGKGVGIACSGYMTGAGTAIYWNKMPHTGVQLKLDRSGLVTVYCGATEVGQGSDDVLVGLVAEILGIDTINIKCVTGDTDLTPVDLGSYSSRVTLMMGNAAIQAAERARELIAEAAAGKLEIPADHVVLAEGKVFYAGDPSRGMTFAEGVVCAEEKHGTLAPTGSYAPPAKEAKFPGAGVGPSPTYSYSAAVVELDVDTATGDIDISRITIAHDIGRALNPVLAEGQIIGSVYMGIGEALMEEHVTRRLAPKLSDALVHRNPSMLDYKSLTMHDMPQVDVEIVEDPDPIGPFGAKEAGQGPLLPIMPAIANAVYDAVGVRIDEVPITPDKILKALKLKASGRDARIGPKRFPEISWPEPIFVLPPWEGGDGKASNKPERSRSAKMHDMDKVKTS